MKGSRQSLSRQARHMLVAVFKDCEPTYDHCSVTLRGITFLLDDRALGALNELASEVRGQFPLQAQCAGTEWRR